MQKRVLLSIFVMGISGITAQILLLRELLVVFQGNELSIGIILANWLILEAAGSFFLGRIMDWSSRKKEWFVFLQIAFAVFLPVTILATRELKTLMGMGLGEGVSLFSIFYGSLLILSLPSMIHGSLFPMSCRVYSSCAGESARGISRVYIVETIGMIIGGITLTYFFIPRVHSLNMAFVISILNIFCCLILLFDFQKKRLAQGSYFLRVVALAFFSLLIYVLFFSGGDALHWQSVHRQWKSQEVVAYQNSLYGNLVVTRQDEQFTFFSDGIPIITTPTPDILFVEEFVHFPLLSHPHPRSALIISAGAGGIIHEILKHPSVETIHYAEIDPVILDLIKRFPTSLTQEELKDPRVTIQHVDGRLLLKKAQSFYDFIFIGASNPSDLQVNRFFTKEFFFLAKNQLSPSGVVVLSLPGDSSYLGDDLRDLNACIFNTLKKVFGHVRVLPGEGMNLYIASDDAAIVFAEGFEISRRILDRDLRLNLIHPPYVDYKLQPRLQRWFFDSMQDATTEINQDLRPIGMFFSLAYWNAMFSPTTNVFFQKIKTISLPLIINIITILFLLFFILQVRWKKFRRLNIPVCVLTTGFFGMMSDLVLIFAFQSFYGYVFHWVGFLVTACMAGVAVGSIFMMNYLERMIHDVHVFLKIEIAIVVFSLLLPFVLFFMSFYPYDLGMQGVFLILSFTSGIFVGAEFPLANKIHSDQKQKYKPNITQTAGLLYALDLAGGWLGGIFGAVVLLAVFGIWGTCVIMAALKIASLTLLLFFCPLKQS